ncbi:hypothetical protein ACNOYE_13790 [Nannocystaceae bacterium ST9]
MIQLSLTTLLLFAPPETPAEPEPEPPGEFGELEASDEPEPAPDAGGGPGAVAPVPNYADELEGRDKPPPVVESKREKKPKVGFEEPTDYGPFFVPAPISEVRFPGDAIRPDRDKPFASVAGGMFCFVEDSACDVSLLADADVGIGVNVVEGGNGLDVPYTQFRVRGGFTVRPLKLARKQWHMWGVGVVASWSLGSGSVLATDDVVELDPLRTWRLALLNQLWLGQRRNALHLDISFGAANSTVLDAPGRYWGTHVELALGFGGWGALALSGDFLDQDSRFVLGLRGHGIATGPLIALVLLGLVAGGVAL